MKVNSDSQYLGHCRKCEKHTAVKEDFFEWLDQCPTEWRLLDTEEETREYIFYNNDDEDEDEKHENEEHDYNLDREQERRENE